MSPDEGRCPSSSPGYLGQNEGPFLQSGRNTPGGLGGWPPIAEEEADADDETKDFAEGGNCFTRRNIP
jgi:hypothetical protein